MKKVFALILALAMVLSVSALAEVEIQTVNWVDVAANAELQVPGIIDQGEFVPVGLTGLMMWIPNGLEAKETIGDAMICYYADEDDTYAVTVFLEDVSDEYDLTDPDGLVAYIRDVLADEVELGIVNGIFCVGYVLGSEDMQQAVVSYATEDGNLLSFVIEPVSALDENNLDTLGFALIASSIMPVE